MKIWGLSFTDFDSYQNKLSRAYIEHKIQSYLEKDPAIRSYYQLTDKVLLIGNITTGDIDYTLHLCAEMETKKRGKPQGLQGVKIAIDPGHFGGEYAELEERAVKLSSAEAGKDIYFCEGTLTYLTALELKKLLIAAGAEVFLTRTAIGKGAIEESFDAWAKKRGITENREKFFRSEYNREDLHCRAKMINAFQPDVTLIIHYNSYQTKEEEAQKRISITPFNYNLTFVPGAFGKGELDKVEDRYEFLRLIVTDAIEESIILSSYLLDQFTQQLQAPVISEYDDAPYLTLVTLKQKEGIYSRNLALTRLVHSPLCYGETLIQNSKNEIYSLAILNAEIDGIPCPQRVKDVAHAYFEGIKRYFIPE